MIKKEKPGAQMTPEQQEFIRLLRQKAEGTPIPMAVEPAMITARLAEKSKKKTPWLKVVSPAALALTACFVLILTGRNGSLMGGHIGTVEESSGVSQSQPLDENSKGSAVTDVMESSGASKDGSSSFVQTPESSEISSQEASEPSSATTTAPSQQAGSSEPQSGKESAPSSEEPVSAPESSADIGSSSADTVPPADSSVSSVPANESSSSKPPASGPEISYLPRNTDNDDYSKAYEALQSAVTPENVQSRYVTGVLSAGISADGLQDTHEKAIITADRGYFYISQQSGGVITIVKADGSSFKRLEVEFETPEIKGLTAGKTAITGCETINGRLFVAGTVTYLGEGGGTARTLSALTCYDVADPENPVLFSKMAQDGAMVGLKMVDSYVYLFSRYYPDSSAPESYPEAYVPFRYQNGSAALAPAEEIIISRCNDESYIVASAFSSKDPGEVSGSLVLQGGGRNFYLGKDGLYLFGERSEDGEVRTLISGISCHSGQLQLAGEVSIPGILNRSGSPNEYGGTLRILTNCYGSSNDTNLFIFDRDLQLLGSTNQLVENQILRSARFEKEKFFFTLYEDRSTAYVLDLSDPANLKKPTRAERTEEALQSVSLRGEQMLRLTGALGRRSMTLTLNGRSRVEDTVTIELQGTYDESRLNLNTYENGRYAALTYSDSGSQKQTVQLYDTSENKLRLVVQHECSSWYGGFRSYLRDGHFYVVTIGEMVIYDAVTGEQLEVVTY